MVKETSKRLTKEDRTETYYWVTKLAHIPLYVKGAYPVLHRFAEQHDVEVVIAGPDDSATEPYVQAVYEAIQQGAAGIMVSGWGDEEIIPAVDAAVESGVPVVSVDGDVPGSKRLAHVGTDWFRMGVAMADKLVALMGERGKVLMMGLADLANIQAGFHGFQYRMAAYSEVEVLGPENDIDVGFGKAEAIVTEYLDKHPDLSGIAGFGINSGPGAAMALEKAGMAGKVKLVCTDTEEPHLEYLKAGVIDAAFAQKRETFTYLAFQMVYAYNHGSLITGYQPGPANISGNIDTGHVIVTEENVETFESELSIEEAFAQQQLSRQVALLSSMIENSADLALATDADGYIMYANPASVRLCGFAEEQMLAFSWEEIFDLTDEQREQIAQCMAQARSTSFETLARRKDGSTLPVQLSVSPMTTDATTSGMVLIATDITERKRAEEVLEKAYAEVEKQVEERTAELRQEIAERERAEEALAYERDLLQALLDNSPDYIFFKDRESRFIRTNKTHAQNLLGISDPREIEGKTDFDLYPGEEESTQRFYEEEQRLMETGEPVVGREWTVPSQATGEEVWLSEHKVPIRSEDGEVVGLVCIGRDITARKRAEEKIEHLNLVLRAIRNVNQLITRERDRDRLLQGACKTLIETRGYHNAWIALFDESEGPGLSKACPEPGPERGRRGSRRGKGPVMTAEAGLGEDFLPLVEQLRRGELTDCGRRALKQSGGVVTEDPSSTCTDCPLSSTYDSRGAVTIRLEYGGKVYGLLSVSIPRDLAADEEEQALFEEVAGDIAFALYSVDLEEERKRAEEALKEYSERLEEMVEERTQELRDAQEQLVRREKLAVLGQLAGGVGHELRNPLGAISNAVYFLNMVLEEPDPEVKETLEILQKEVKASTSIISSLLDFARAKAPTRRKVDINDVVQEALSRTAIPENVEVATQLDETLPIILADPDQLGQVFGNIILNAVQAMPEGGQLVVKSEAPSAEWVAISVTDTGVGIPEESLGQVFEPLFTTKAKGIGLGMAVTKTLVDGHGGAIEVESEVGKGTTFKVTLPILVG